MKGYFLVGEAPNLATVGKPHLWLMPDNSGIPHTANRLVRLTGWAREQYLAVFPHRTNIWPIPTRRWKFEGRAHADAIKRQASTLELDGIILLGASAAECFGLADWPRCVWSGAWTRPIAVVPHTSGRCRFWNEPENLALGRAFLESLLP